MVAGMICGVEKVDIHLLPFFPSSRLFFFKNVDKKQIFFCSVVR